VAENGAAGYVQHIDLFAETVLPCGWDSLLNPHREHTIGGRTMSGLFGQLLSTILGGQQEGQSAAIGNVLQQVLTANGGGVASLLSRFEAAGLGSQAQSWVSTNRNLPISADQIGAAFSANEIEGWAAQAGTTPDKLRAVLAEALPHAVDHVTPAGQVPAPNAIPDLSSLVSRFFSSGQR
jgi:uncharacterized protein YidB (DUF937 family)